ncbi:Exo-glucosaminidase lytG precursor [Weeksella virosa]|uniref:glucosaminidase domain-containing protein n=1 Tax=Weeksella virosa TaxID=1014 RepID=UPI000E01316E|nr:glucosaminidase domain-containing protein [Weeksella virosa]SUP54932.1 Exo-glucosaminidase lytG precursor [Weeksella virosa]
MKKLIIFFGLVATSATYAQNTRDIDYIRKHALLAVKEQALYNIPASITLSQGLIETGGGQSRLANQAYNHFGIKCKAEWTGDKIYHDDDAKGECFRAYATVEDSYRDHSKFLAERPYYKNLFTLSVTDYKGWAYGLKKAGYATNPRYPNMLISKIEQYNLQQFDMIKEEDVYAKLVSLYGHFDAPEGGYWVSSNSNPSKNTKTRITQENKKEEKTQTIKEDEAIRVILASNTNTIKDKKHNTSAAIQPKEELNQRERNIIFNSQPELPSLRMKNHPNNIQYVVVKNGETLGSLAKMYNTAPSKLAQYNEITLGSTLQEGQIIFFGMKKTKGTQETYQVREGEDMYTISQKFGIKVNNLYRINRMEPGTQPKAGQMLSLKKRIKA